MLIRMDPTSARPLATIVLTLVGVLLCGCTGSRDPEFTAVGIRLDEPVDGTIPAVITIEGQNPSEDAIPLDILRYRVTLNGETVFRAKRTPDVVLPSYRAQRFQIPALLPEGVTADDEVSVAGSVSYRIPGVFASLMHDAKIWVPKAPMRVTFTGDADDQAQDQTRAQIRATTQSE